MGHTFAWIPASKYNNVNHTDSRGKARGVQSSPCNRCKRDIDLELSIGARVNAGHAHDVVVVGVP